MGQGQYQTDMIREIRDLLDMYGRSFTEVCRDDCTIFQVDCSSCDEGKTLSIVAIPVCAMNLEEAQRQRMAMESIIGKPDVIAVTEDRWESRKEMMLKRLLAHTGVYRSVFARDCEVRRIGRGEADAFLSGNHSYGGAKCRYCYGLFLKRARIKDHGIAVNPGAAIPAIQETGTEGNQREMMEDEGRMAGQLSDAMDWIDWNDSATIGVGSIVAVAEFSNARRWQKSGRTISSYEWVRYASLPDVRISGGMGKILKRFIADLHPDDIMSYADLEWSDGAVYRQLGFTEDGFKAPVTFLVSTDDWKRIPLKPAALTSFQNPCAGHLSIDMSDLPMSVSAKAHTGCTDNAPENPVSGPVRYFQNPGSAKFRLKLTDY